MTRDMDCQTARLHLLDDQRGRLDPAAATALGAHLAGCPECSREEMAERLLTEQLERHLPQHAAPLALKRRLAAQWHAAPAARPARGVAVDGPSRESSGRRTGWPHRRPARSWRQWALIAACLVAVVVASTAVASWLVRGNPAERLVAEAVNDHLRVLARGPSLDVASGDMHQVRPWLTGRLDFAPVIRFAGDADFPLRGGTVEYFLDRRAAVAVFGRRLHTVTLIVTRADGLPWPDPPSVATRVRGFNVRLWQRDGLGYALVSDLDAAELAHLAARLGG